MPDIDAIISDKESAADKITQEVRDAFSKGGKNGAVLAMAQHHSEIQGLSDVDWLTVKAGTSSLHNMTKKELDSLRRKNKVQVSNGWMAEIELDSNGVIKGGLKNCNIILKSHEQLKGKLRFNSFLMRPVITENVSFLRHIKIEENGWIEVDGMVFPQLRSWLAMDFAEFGKDCLADAVDNVSLHDQFNPLTEILDGCEADWDEKERLDSWLSDLCGAESSKYVSAVGSKWMISAVARAYQPGCKVDTMLILEGDQGVGKSSFLRELSFGYFLELLTDISKGKDVIDKMLGKWIIEMPELKALSGDREANKAFLTQQEDTERLSYARRSQGYPRRCVFIGTTNEQSYLRDDTGERRYWPVNVKHCDIKKLKECLGQLWGEAVVRYKKGESWWLEDQKLVDSAIEAQADKSEMDEMESEVIESLTHIAMPFKALEIWINAFGGNKVSFEKSSQMRVAKILRKLGYVPCKKDKTWNIA